MTNNLLLPNGERVPFSKVAQMGDNVEVIYNGEIVRKFTFPNLVFVTTKKLEEDYEYILYYETNTWTREKRKENIRRIINRNDQDIEDICDEIINYENKIERLRQDIRDLERQNMALREDLLDV